MVKKELKFIFFVIIILIINVLIFFLGKYTSPKKENLAYGTTIKNFSVFDIEGNSININNSGKYWKLIYISSLKTNKDLRDVYFLNMLHKKINEPTLKIIGMFKISKLDIIDLRDRADISFNIISYHENPILKKILNIETEANILIFLNPSNEIKFISSFFFPHDIKQLIEKFVVGEISYSPIEISTKSPEGSLFPIINVKNLITGDYELFPQGRTVAVIFTARCPDCLLERLKYSFPIIEEGIIELESSEVSFIFSSKFLEQEILENFQGSVLKLLQAKDNIPWIEDYFKSLYYTKEEIIVVKVDEDRRITYFDSIKEYIKNNEILINGGER